MEQCQLKYLHSHYPVGLEMLQLCYGIVFNDPGHQCLCFQCTLLALSTYNAKSVADPGFDLKGGGVERLAFRA